MKPPNSTNNGAGSDCQKRLVRLLQCGRKSCGHVLTESERDWVKSKDFEGARTAVCPECGNDDFYTLNAAGQAMTTRDMRDGADREIDPATIEPSPRMGPKMKARILDAKRRALESLPNDLAHTRAGAQDAVETTDCLPKNEL